EKEAKDTMQLIGFDLETAGDEDGYALQPWRVLEGRARITSFAMVGECGTSFATGLNPDIERIRKVLSNTGSDVALVTWNGIFDVAWLIAYGLEDVVRKNTWLDGEVLRRCLENDTSDKPYGLKPTVAKYLPEFAGYEEGIGGDFNAINDTLL